MDPKTIPKTSQKLRAVLEAKAAEGTGVLEAFSAVFPGTVPQRSKY